MKNVSYFCPYEATQQLFMINRLKLKPLFTIKSKNFDQSNTRIHKPLILGESFLYPCLTSYM